MRLLPLSSFNCFIAITCVSSNFFILWTGYLCIRVFLFRGFCVFTKYYLIWTIFETYDSFYMREQHAKFCYLMQNCTWFDCGKSCVINSKPRSVYKEYWLCLSYRCQLAEKAWVWNYPITILNFAKRGLIVRSKRNLFGAHFPSIFVPFFFFLIGKKETCIKTKNRYKKWTRCPRKKNPFTSQKVL